MVYLLSFIIYAIIFIIGAYLILKNSPNLEFRIAVLILIGFFIQVFIDWASLGNITSLPQITVFGTAHGYLEFLILTLVSVFCYAALLVALYQVYRYHQKNQKSA